MTEKEAMQLSREYADTVFMKNTSSHLCAQAGFYHGVMSRNKEVEDLKFRFRQLRDYASDRIMLPCEFLTD